MHRLLARDEGPPKKLPPAANRIPLLPLYHPLIEPSVGASRSARLHRLRLHVSPIRTRVKVQVHLRLRAPRLGPWNLTMASNTKRKRCGSVRQAGAQQPRCKKARTGESQEAPPPASLARHAVISQYYPSVLSLRQYMLAELPSSSRIRRKKITTAGRASQSSGGGVSGIGESLGRLLDTTLVGLPEQTKSHAGDLWDQWTSFSQRGDESTVTLSDGLAGAAFSQSEVSRIELDGKNTSRTDWWLL